MNTLIIHPAVTAAIRGYLVKRGVPSPELDDAVAEVQTRTLENLEDRRHPGSVDGWQALAITVARNLVCNRARDAGTADKYDEGPCEKPDDYAAFAPSGPQRDPVDAKRQLAVLLEMFAKGEMPEQGREILEAVADGVKIPAIGRELGLPAKEVRKRLRKMRTSYFRRLGSLGMLVLMVALLAIVGGPAVVAVRTGPQPVPVPGAGPSGGQTGEDGEDRGAVPSPAALEMARTMRRDGLRACDAGRWDECAAKLDAARAVDPGGDGAAEVKRARQWADEVREERMQELDAKPR